MSLADDRELGSASLDGNAERRAARGSGAGTGAQEPDIDEDWLEVVPNPRGTTVSVLEEDDYVAIVEQLPLASAFARWFSVAVCWELVVGVCIWRDARRRCARAGLRDARSSAVRAGAACVCAWARAALGAPRGGP